MKKVSLILTTYNSGDNLPKTLNSIDDQDYPKIEIVIKDGASADGTLNIIEEYQQSSRFDVKWISKPDSGIYEAMNQGYALCTGDIIVFFNDMFTHSTVISKMVELMDTPSRGEPYVGAHADLVYKEGKRLIRRWKMGEGNIYQGWMPGHPTLFLRREIYEKYGLYDTKYKIGADYEFMIRFLKDKGNRLAYLPETTVTMFYGGTSNGGLKNYLLSLAEGHRALRQNGIKFAWYIDIRRTIRVLLQFVR